MADSQSPSGQSYSPHGLTRWYMDTRALTASSSNLPLLQTLRPEDQEAVKRYYHLADKHMSLASCLLKYLFIHRACHVNWDKITISRTPAPHKRPCYIPLAPQKNDENSVPSPNVEFNVSHQASFVALAGCTVPAHITPNNATSPSPSPSTGHTGPPQVGIDITCTDERSRRGKDSIPSTEADLHSFLDIYAEVFSPREIELMKSNPNQQPQYGSQYGSQSLTRTKMMSLEETIEYRLRRFYAYWALKEAYIKMTGEALLAPWLKELQFFNVVPPESAIDDEGRPQWGSPTRDVVVKLYGEVVSDVRIELVAFGKEYLVATATRGGDGQSGVGTWGDFRRIDLDSDVEPCALGRCRCPVGL